MKVIKKTYCPDEVKLPGGTILKMYVAASALPNMNAKRKAAELQAQGIAVCIVEVLSNNLKGRTDLHGNLYTPNVFIYTDLNTDEKIQAWREEVDFWKSQFRPRTKKYLQEVKRRNRTPKAAELWTGKETAQNQAIKELLN